MSLLTCCYGEGCDTVAVWAIQDKDRPNMTPDERMAAYELRTYSCHDHLLDMTTTLDDSEFVERLPRPGVDWDGD